MLPKPESCRKCPLYDDGIGYVPDEVVDTAHVFVMLQNPGGDEELGRLNTDGSRTYAPAIGAAGRSLDSDFIPLAGLTRGKDVSVGNVIKCRWRHPHKGIKTNDLPSKTGAYDPVKGEITKAKGEEIERVASQHCVTTLTRIPNSTKLIVGAGDLAWNGLDQPGSITQWRGFIGPNLFRDQPVFGTYHPVYTFHQPRMTVPVMADWQKVRRILDGTWPLPVPPYRTVQAPGDIPDGTRFVSIDAEFNPDTYKIYLLGIAYFGDGPEPLGGEQIWVYDHNVESVRSAVYRLISHVPAVAWNAIAETLALESTFGIPPSAWLQMEDPMQLHALLHSEWPHDLGFVESMHGRHHRMKHLSDTDVALYNWGDCLTAGYAFQDMMRMQEKDSLSFRVYREQNLPLISIRHEAKRVGLALDREFLAELSNDLARRIQHAQDSAEGYTGFPLNLGSHPQFTGWIQDVEGIKLKSKKGVEGVSADKDAVAELRRKFYDFDPEEEKDGITPEILERNIREGGHPLLESRAMFQNARQLYSHFLVPLLAPGIPVGGDVHGFDPSDFVAWVSPNQHTHTQASGRWSTVDPPLPTLPKKLRKMIRPPAGYALVKYDADQQELRINAHLAHDEPTLEVFQNGWDIHTTNTCDVFALVRPPDPVDPHGSSACEIWRVEVHWEGKDDRRRVFSKRFVYRLIYRGDPKYAGDIPGAKALGLTSAGLVSASKNYISQHPALPRYWKRLDSKIMSTRIVRSFRGRKRFLNGSASAKPGQVPAICREGTNHPIQSGGVDWCNLLILTLYDECRDLGLIWGFGAHDSHNWLVPEQHEYSFRERVKEVTMRPWDVDGRPLILPVSLDPTIYPLAA